MKYAINAAPDFLRVEVSGRDTDEPPSHMCAAVYDATVKHGCLRVLVELDQKFPLSPTSQYHLVTNLRKIGFTAEERIALVHRTPEAQNANHFINLLARNHGVMVRNFNGVEPAKKWLRGEPG